MYRFSMTVIILLLAELVFAGLSVTPTIGAGYITGNRVFVSDQSSYRKLAATGIEAGVVLGYDITQKLRSEAYFDYLFAIKGDMVYSEQQSTQPKTIAPDMTYTNYKAGIGVGYFISLNEKNDFRISAGCNFAGISNHQYSSTTSDKKIENEINGNKVTSFGGYLELADHNHVSSNMDFVIAIHGCYNTIGWIRTLNNHKWINHFNEKADIKLVSIFGQMGICCKIR